MYSDDPAHAFAQAPGQACTEPDADDRAPGGQDIGIPPGFLQACKVYILLQ